MPSHLHSPQGPGPLDDDAESFSADPDGTVPTTADDASGIRVGSLVWGLIALLVSLWSLSVVLLDWSIDPVLMGIGLAGLVGVALIVGGIAGAARRGD